jgi:cytochrome c peroxidase
MRAAASVLLASIGLTSSAFAQELPPVPTPNANPTTPEKVLLGKMLFWDEQLSSDNTVACGTCHTAQFGGGDGRVGTAPGLDGMFGTPDDISASPGVMDMDLDGVYVDNPAFGMGPQVTGRRAPAFYGNLWSNLMFWDGRAGPGFDDPISGAPLLNNAASLEAQAVGPILNDVEMAHEGRTWADVTSKLAAAQPMALSPSLTPDIADALQTAPSYPTLFAQAFGDGEVTPARIGMAIAAYERTQVPDQTPYDAFVDGDPTALTPQQARGLGAFRATTCDVCHDEPLFTDNTFRNVGLRPIVEDPGRQEVTGNPGDAGRFKTPSLRNVGLSETFMHNGQLTSLEQVIDFYLGINGQVQFPQNQDPAVRAVNIPPPARADIVAFLRDGLTDPRVEAGLPPFDHPELHAAIGACNDGIDNDGDGFADAGEDAGCASPEDTSETAHDQLCDDGLDNDGDGLTDWQDADCDGGVFLCFGDASMGDTDADGTCDDLDLCFGDDASGDLDLDGTCNDLDLLLTVAPMVLGEASSMTATGAPEGANVLFFASVAGEGTGMCAPNTDVCLDITQVIQLGAATADAAGDATLDLVVPATLADGTDVWFQAAYVTGGDGESSNVEMETVTDGVADDGGPGAPPPPGGPGGPPPGGPGGPPPGGPGGPPPGN